MTCHNCRIECKRNGKNRNGHIERQNLSIRMGTRRLTRLTNAFSKKWENHWAALALRFAWYNFSRVHRTLRDARNGSGDRRSRLDASRTDRGVVKHFPPPMFFRTGLV